MTVEMGLSRWPGARLLDVMGPRCYGLRNRLREAGMPRMGQEGVEPKRQGPSRIALRFESRWNQRSEGTWGTA
jgi:hypothetical protein